MLAPPHAGPGQWRINARHLLHTSPEGLPGRALSHLADRRERAAKDPMCHGCAAEILRVRHHRLLVPHDFDVSLYSAVIKPTSAAGFDRYASTWHEDTQKPIA